MLSLQSYDLPWRLDNHFCYHSRNYRVLLKLLQGIWRNVFALSVTRIDFKSLSTKCLCEAVIFIGERNCTLQLVDLYISNVLVLNSTFKIPFENLRISFSLALWLDTRRLEQIVMIYLVKISVSIYYWKRSPEIIKKKFQCLMLYSPHQHLEWKHVWSPSGYLRTFSYSGWF